jgi:hypothetical protein
MMAFPLFKPFLFDDVVKNEEALKGLAGLDCVGICGGALGLGAGDNLDSAGIRLPNLYGTTEAGPMPSTFVSKDNYNWQLFRLALPPLYRYELQRW